MAGGAGDAAAAVRFAKRVLDATRADATGGALEEVSTRLFRVCLGYSVDRVGGSHDRGIDLKMRSADDVPCVAQCKSKRSGDVSFVEVSAFLGAMGIAGVMHGLFVTNAAFTAAARKAAEEWAAAAPERALHLYSCEELSAMCCKHHPALAQDHYVQSLLEHAAVMPQHTPQRRRAGAAAAASGGSGGGGGGGSSHGKRSPRQPEEAAAVLQRAARRRSSLLAAGLPSLDTAARGTPSSGSSWHDLENGGHSQAHQVTATRSPFASPAWSTAPRRERRKWSSEEEQLLCRLWLELGFQAKVEARARLPWKEMLDRGNATDPGVFDVCREPGHLKDKGRNSAFWKTISVRSTGPELRL